MNLTPAHKLLISQFRTTASKVDAKFELMQSYCELVKNGIRVRVRWIVDGISGIFVTVAPCEARQDYGLCYLVEYWGGSSEDISKAYSDDITAIVEVAEKYVARIFNELGDDFKDFEEFTQQRIRENLEKLPPITEIEKGAYIKRGWAE